MRCPDPFVQLRGRWIVRRLSPHCSRIELATLKAHGKEMRLLSRDGTGNGQHPSRHQDRPQADPRAHARSRKGSGCTQATEEMLKAVREDWKTWKKAGLRLSALTGTCPYARLPSRSAMCGSRRRRHALPGPPQRQPVRLRRLPVIDQRPLRGAIIAQPIVLHAAAAVAAREQTEAPPTLPVWSSAQSRPETVCPL